MKSFEASKAGRTGKNISAVVLAVMLVFSLVQPVLAQTTVPGDTKGHWAEPVIRQWMANGWINGYPDGTFQPDRTITRAETAALINRAFGIEPAGESPFRDVQASDWYFKDVAAAAAEGYIRGYEDNTFRPHNPITRQELAVIISRLLKLSDGTSDFADQDDIAGWSKGAVGAAVEKGIISGYPDNTFRPSRNATRAEVVTVLDRALKQYEQTQATAVFDEAGTYGPAAGNEIIDGNVIVSASGVYLRNMTINGDLLVADSVGDGDVWLEHVTVNGVTLIEGGGAESVHVIHSFLVNVVVNKADNSVRIVVSGNTTVQEVVLQSGAKLEEADDVTGAGFSVVRLAEQLPQHVEVELVGSFETVEVLSTEVRVSIPKGSVEQLTVAENAAGATIELGEEAAIVELIINAVAAVVGSGKIQTAKVNADATIEPEPEHVEVAEGVNLETGGQQPAQNETGSTAPPNTFQPDPGPTPDPEPQDPEEPGDDPEPQDPQEPGSGDDPGSEPEPEPQDPEEPGDVLKVKPEAGTVKLTFGDTFRLTVTASVYGLHSLTIANDIPVTEAVYVPPITVVADPVDPYGGNAAEMEGYGIEVAYAAEEQEWTIDFGEDITDQLVARGRVIFTMIVKDQEDNELGGDDFEYTFEWLPAYQFVVDESKTATIYEDLEFMVPVSIERNSDHDIPAFDKVLILFRFTSPETAPDAKVDLEAYDSTGKKHRVTDLGYWGPSTGFPIGKNYEATTEFFVTFSDPGEYTFDFRLVDLQGKESLELGELWDLKGASVLAEGSYTVEVKPADADAALPEMISSLPGNNYIVNKPNDFTVYLQDGETFKLVVTASDDFGLYSLEVDHNRYKDSGIPEFKLYASEDNPFGSSVIRQRVQQMDMGVEVTYVQDGNQGTWTIDFGDFTDWIAAKGGIQVYLVLKNLSGKTWGSMSPPTEANTFSYTIKRLTSYEIVVDQLPEKFIPNHTYDVNVTLKPEEGKQGAAGYDNVRFKIDIEKPPGANVSLMAMDTSGNWHDVAAGGYWGPPDGFPIGPGYTATTRFQATFSDAGPYTITIRLIDLANDDALITQHVIRVFVEQPGS